LLFPVRLAIHKEVVFSPSSHWLAGWLLNDHVQLPSRDLLMQVDKDWTWLRHASTKCTNQLSTG